MISQPDLRVIHVFPYSARLSGGHSDAIIGLMEGEIRHGIDARGLCPLGEGMPPEQTNRVENLPLREVDFAAPDFLPTAMESVAGCQHPIFHFHGSAREYIPLARYLVKAQIPYVITSHGQLHYREQMHWLAKFAYVNFLVRFFRDASGLRFLTRREEERCRYLLPFWMKPVFVSPNLVSIPDPGAVSSVSREQYGIPAQAFVFAFLGRLHVQHKGLDLLMKAFAKLPASGDPYLVLIGPDWAGGRELLEALAKRLNCEGRIRFLGAHFGESKWRALKMADAFVSPSRWEAFGIAQAEAIGFGLPTIVSNKQNLAPELASHGAALVVPASPCAFGCAMQELIQDATLRQSLSSRGRKWVQECCASATAGGRLNEFYLQVIRSTKSPSRLRLFSPSKIRSSGARDEASVVHVFPYTPRLSGGHSNAIQSFINCQRAKGINAVGVSREPDEWSPGTSWEFPLAEIGSLWELRWQAIAERFQIAAGNTVIHFHSVNLRLAPFVSDLRRAGVPYVLTSHGQLGYRGRMHLLGKFVYLHWVNSHPRNAAGVHLLTKFAERRFKFLLPGYRGAVLVQGNLVNLPNLITLPAGKRSDYRIPEDAFVLLFLGRLDVWGKGLDLLVEAFSCLPSGRARLLLAGPDWNGGKAELEQLAERFGCRDRVHFTGPIYGEKKWSLLQMADLFVSPSRWEAFNIAQAEAMAVGLPVVTSTKVNLAPDLREADAALLAPPAAEPLAQAIATLAADGERRRALGTRGKAWAERNCDPDRAGARFREFYQAILDQASGAGR